MKELKCQVAKCDKQSDLIYYRNGLCEFHWQKHCDGKLDLKAAFRIKADTIKKGTP